MLSSVVRPALQYFSTLSHKRHDIREKPIEHEECVLIIFKIFYGSFTVQCVSSATRTVSHLYNNVLVLPLTVYI